MNPKLTINSGGSLYSLNLNELYPKYAQDPGYAVGKLRNQIVFSIKYSINFKSYLDYYKIRDDKLEKMMCINNFNRYTDMGVGNCRAVFFDDSIYAISLANKLIEFTKDRVIELGLVPNSYLLGVEHEDKNFAILCSLPPYVVKMMMDLSTGRILHFDTMNVFLPELKNVFVNDKSKGYQLGVNYIRCITTVSSYAGAITELSPDETIIQFIDCDDILKPIGEALNNLFSLPKLSKRFIWV